MTENPANISAVCGDCSEERLRHGRYTGVDPRTFIGQYVKLGFPATNPADGSPSKEHMWVRVERLALHGRGLLGKLDNDPVLVCEYKFGDDVVFTVADIEAVDTGGVVN